MTYFTRTPSPPDWRILCSTIRTGCMWYEVIHTIWWAFFLKINWNVKIKHFFYKKIIWNLHYTAWWRRPGGLWRGWRWGSGSGIDVTGNTDTCFYLVSLFTLWIIWYPAKPNLMELRSGRFGMFGDEDLESLSSCFFGQAWTSKEEKWIFLSL